MKNSMKNLKIFKNLKSPNRFILYICLLILCACVTSSHQLFRQVKVGDHKSDVLEILGSPQKTHRHKDQDIWTYQLVDQNQESQQMIIFENNKVIKIIPLTEEPKGLKDARTLEEYENEVEKLRKTSNPPPTSTESQTESETTEP